MNDCGYNQTYGLIYIKIHNFTTYVEFFTCYCFGGVFLMVNVKKGKSDIETQSLHDSDKNNNKNN